MADYFFSLATILRSIDAESISEAVAQAEFVEALANEENQ